MDLVLRDLPSRLEKALQELAERHNTTIEAEAMDALDSKLTDYLRRGAPALEILARIEAAGIRTPGNSVKIIRRMRDGR